VWIDPDRRAEKISAAVEHAHFLVDEVGCAYDPGRTVEIDRCREVVLAREEAGRNDLGLVDAGLASAGERRECTKCKRSGKRSVLHGAEIRAS
jgi:hypothetical protein